jgi:hypothetical protein
VGAITVPKPPPAVPSLLPLTRTPPRLAADDPDPAAGAYATSAPRPAGDPPARLAAYRRRRRSVGRLTPPPDGPSGHGRPPSEGAAGGNRATFVHPCAPSRAPGGRYTSDHGSPTPPAARPREEQRVHRTRHPAPDHHPHPALRLSHLPSRPGTHDDDPREEGTRWLWTSRATPTASARSSTTSRPRPRSSSGRSSASASSSGCCSVAPWRTASRSRRSMGSDCIELDDTLYCEDTGAGTRHRGHRRGRRCRPHDHAGDDRRDLTKGPPRRAAPDARPTA